MAGRTEEATAALHGDARRHRSDGRLYGLKPPLQPVHKFDPVVPANPKLGSPKTACGVRSCPCSASRRRRRHPIARPPSGRRSRGCGIRRSCWTIASEERFVSRAARTGSPAAPLAQFFSSCCALRACANHRSEGAIRACGHPACRAAVRTHTCCCPHTPRSNQLSPSSPSHIDNPLPIT